MPHEGAKFLRAPTPPTRGATLMPLFRLRHLGLAFDPDGDASGNGGGSGSGLEIGTRPPTPAEIRQYLATNDHSRFQLATDLASQLATANARVAELQSKVGKADESATLLAQYQALGKPEDLTAAVAERDTLKATIAERQALDARTEFFEKAAGVYGWDVAAARKVAARVPLAGVYEFREVEVEEKDARGVATKVKKQIPHVVTGEGAASKAEPLDAVMARDHDLLVPALTAKPAEQRSERRDPLPPAPRSTGPTDAPPPAAAESVRRRAVGAF